MNWIIAYIVVFVVQYVINYGGTVAYFQGKYPRVRSHFDGVFAGFMSLLSAAMPIVGPIIIYCLTRGFHYGFKFRTEGPTGDTNWGYDINGDRLW